jgi:hypothetical protein
MTTDDQQPTVETPSNLRGSPTSDAASGEAIQLRADARLSKRVKYLQNELNGKIALIAKLSEDLATAQRQAAAEIAQLNTRIKTLATERDSARADRDHQARNFNGMLNAMRSMRGGDYDHVVPALREQGTNKRARNS